MDAQKPALHIAINGYYAGQPVGSGRYIDELLKAFAMFEEGAHGAGGGNAFSVISPQASRRRSRFTKVHFEQRAFPKRARASGADIAHIPYWAPPLIPSLPTVVTMHDIIPLVLPEYRRSPLAAGYFKLVAGASRRATHIIADSQHSADDIVSYLDIPPEQISVIPLGVDPRFQPIASSRIEQLRNRLRLPKRYVLYLGGFDPRKNLETLLAAWQKLNPPKDLGLVIGGQLPRPDHPLLLDPRTQAGQLGLDPSTIHFLGKLPSEDLPTLYSGAELFAFPSRYEGFGLTPLEAMACGTPVISSSSSSLPEVVGSAGLSVDPESVEAWVEAIQCLMEDADERRRFARAGLQRASQFTWEVSAQKTSAVYRSLEVAR